MSREQLVAILWRYTDMRGVDNGRRASLRDFRDARTFSDYAYEPLCWAIGMWVLQGTAEGLLNLSGTAT